MGVTLQEWHALTPEQREKVSEAKQDRLILSWELHCKGCNYSEVSRRTGVSVNQARLDVLEMQDIMASELMHTINQERALDHGRLEGMLDTFLKRANDGDVDAARVVLATMVRKSKLLGLDQPTKFQHQVLHGRPKSTVSTEELNRRLEKLYNRLKERGRPINEQLERWHAGRIIDVTPVEGVGKSEDNGRAAEMAANSTISDDKTSPDDENQ